MRFVPESIEVVQAAIEDLVHDIDLAMAADSLELAEEALVPKFLQGGLYITQLSVVVLGTIGSLLEHLESPLVDFSFNDLFQFHDDESEAIEVLDTLFKSMLMQNVEGFRQIVAQSYYMGFGAVASWMIPMIKTISLLSDTLAEDEEDDDDDTEEP